MAASAKDPVPLNLSAHGFDLIAEAKLVSPSQGVLDSSSDATGRVVELAAAYASAGSVAISVLTEPSRFGGHLDHLEAASKLDVPVMRKDFLVDPIQVIEARASGASGVLLIARMAGGALLEEMTDLALEQGMFVLLEVFDREDIERGSVVFDRSILLGVNTRDLSTLEVDSNRLADLITELPDHLPLVAESGVTAAVDAVNAVRLGYDVALVGTGLVSSTDPGGLAASMLEAGRSAAVSR
jgi:indole-3-glycerol phosphate synthase